MCGRLEGDAEQFVKGEDGPKRADPFFFLEIARWGRKGIGLITYQLDCRRRGRVLSPQLVQTGTQCEGDCGGYSMLGWEKLASAQEVVREENLGLKRINDTIWVAAEEVGGDVLHCAAK